MPPLLDPIAQIRARFRKVAAQVGAPTVRQEASAAASPWLTSQELAEYLRLTDRRRPREAAVDWAKRHHIVSVLVNRERRFARRDVEAALGSGTKCRRRSA